MDPITPRTVETKLEIATKYAEYLRGLLANDAQNEDLFCLLSVAENYADDMRRVISKHKLTELEFYRLRNSQLLAATLIEEAHQDHDLTGWSYGCDEGDNVLWLAMNQLTEAHLQMTNSMEQGRARNYLPLTKAEIAAIVAIL